jgi:drug/metabolite transporter superfamily protein YnfA
LCAPKRHWGEHRASAGEIYRWGSLPPFWFSIAFLSLFQGALVAIPGTLRARALGRLRGRRWALIPPLSIVVFVFGARAAESASAQGLTYLALAGVPLLAILALGWLVRGARPRWVLLVPLLFALAWVDRGHLPGQTAALLLCGLSCAALGVLLAAVTPPKWLSAGIVAMALADTALVASELLQRPNNALNAARPVAGLPQLQSAVFGSAVMGYGDLFIAGALGGLLALEFGRATQLRAAVLTAALALASDLLFFVLDELPATVPVALALVVVLLRRRRLSARRAEAARAPLPPEPRGAGSPAARPAR